jgi:hypothetical protein
VPSTTTSRGGEAVEHPRRACQDLRLERRDRARHLDRIAAAVEHPPAARAQQVEREAVPLPVPRVARADDRDPVARLHPHAAQGPHPVQQLEQVLQPGAVERGAAGPARGRHPE